MLHPAETYEDLTARFDWSLPGRYNIATAICDDWAAREPERVCLEYFEPDGNHRRMSYGTLAGQAARFANGLRKAGIAHGDRVALLLPQSFETVIAHVAIYKLGAIAVPLALLFGPDALDYRLKLSGAKAIVTNAMGLGKLDAIAERPRDLGVVVSVETEPGANAVSFTAMIAGNPATLETVDTAPETPAMMIFTSGTTGPPKGALHGHGVLPGHLPGIQFAHEFLPRPGDRMWTPADWAWAGGLLNALMPALSLGVPVVASRAQKFDADTAFRILAGMKVRNAFIPPTALRLMRTVENPQARYDFDLRSISSAGEPLGHQTYEWAHDALGVTVNELYGQTECNAVLASCAGLGVSRSGAIGKPVPGHAVALLGHDGKPVPSGKAGEIAIRRPDPVMFLGYWENPEATRAKFSGDWMLTGDQAVADDDGYVSFFGRDDDIITSAGFRIGPGEIEDCLTGHPAVALAAAVGKPDPVRTEIVKVYVVLKAGYEAGDPLAAEIRNWVKTRLSAHEYPREVAFVDDLPLTTTGKVIRRALRERAATE